jgi:hypothetical protein
MYKVIFHMERADAERYVQIKGKTVERAFLWCLCASDKGDVHQA